MKRDDLEATGSQSAATETTPLVSKEGSSGGDAETPANKSGGLSVNQTALLIAGEMAGSGVLALPRALVKTAGNASTGTASMGTTGKKDRYLLFDVTIRFMCAKLKFLKVLVQAAAAANVVGWVGVPILVVMCVIAAFSGKRLGDCWTMIEARDPGMRSSQRTPYAIIANQALGKKWSVAVSVAMMGTLFGASVVYLLMAAQIVQEVLLSLTPSVSFCAWYLIVAGATTPLIMFTSPKNFPMTGVVAFASTVVACVLYFIQMMNDIRPYPTFRYGIHGFQDFFLAFGTIMFAFGGASTFPTIQNDMTEKAKFNTSLVYSFGAVLCLYLPIAVAGYAVYGESVAPNLAASVSATPLTLVANVLMAVHLVTAFAILINPVCQEAEEMYNVPRDATGSRMAIRLSIMAAILFIGETIPRFYTILALVGGTTVALLTFILPSYCYLKLTELAPVEGQTTSVVEQPGWMKMVCWEVIIVGLVGGVAATYSAVSAIFSTAQATPCYLK